MLGLTKEEAITLHRELWNWVSENPNKFKEDWPKWDDYQSVANHCFCCEYNRQQTIDKMLPTCKGCILKWPDGKDDYFPCEYTSRWTEFGIEEGNGLHFLYLIACSDDESRFDVIRELAKQIRDLPINDNYDESIYRKGY